MANIFTILQKEVEKGNLLMDKKGNFINPEKLENTMRKSYLAGLKNGSISFEKPFAEYQQNEIEKMFIPVSAVESAFAYYVDYPKCFSTESESEPAESYDCMPEPQETVAQ